MLEELVQLHRAGRFDEAEDGYRHLLDANPHNAEALHLLGILRGQCGDLSEAFKLIRRASELDPNNATCRHTLGEMYLSEGRLDEAAQAYDQARQLNPGLAAAHSGLGQVALLRGDAGLAESCFKSALGVDENDVQALTGLGAVAQLRGDSQRALQLLTQAAELAPDDPLIQTECARALIEQGMLDFAARALDKALAAKADYPMAQVLRADVHVRKGDVAAALPIYESLLARGEQVAASWLGEGDIARAQGHHDEAITRYGEALREQPDLHPAAIRRADLLARTRRISQAIDELRLHVANHPDSADAHATLARLLTRAGCSDEAFSVWTAAEARWPGDIDLKAQHALALDSSGYLDEALKLAEIAAQSPRPALVMLRARHALLTGDPAAAVQRLQHTDQHQFEGEPPQLARRQQRLLGLAFDALEQWADAAQAFVRGQAVTKGTLPDLPSLDEAGCEALRCLAAEPDFADARGTPPVFLCGLPGSGVGQVAALLADQPGWFVRRERFEAAPDFVNAPFDANLIQALGQSGLDRLARRYRQPLQRAGLADTVRVVDWIPVLDARVVPAIRRALPGSRLIIVQRAPHDMLLDWLGFGWSEGFSMPDPLTGARWLRLAATHLELAAEVLPTFHVDPDAAMAVGDPDVRMRLGVFLGLVDLKPGPMARGARKGRGGLPVNFPPGHSSHYREVFSEAFATLDG